MGDIYIHAGLGVIILAVYVFILLNISSVMPGLEEILNARSWRTGGKASQQQGKFYILALPVVTAALLIWPLMRHILSFQLGLISNPQAPNFIFYFLGYIAFGYTTIVWLALL